MTIDIHSLLEKNPITKRCYNQIWVQVLRTLQRSFRKTNVI